MATLTPHKVNGTTPSHQLFTGRNGYLGNYLCLASHNACFLRRNGLDAVSNY